MTLAGSCHDWQWADPWEAFTQFNKALYWQSPNTVETKALSCTEVNCFESCQLQSPSHSWAGSINERGRRKVKNKCRFEKDTHLCVHRRTALQGWPSPPANKTALDVKGTEGEGSFLHWEGAEDLWCPRNKYECYLPTTIKLIFSVSSNVSNWGELE